MLNSKETITIVERILNKLDITNILFNNYMISDEESLLIKNLLENYTSTNDLKLILILKLFLSYLDVSKSNKALSKENYLNLREILKSIRFNEIELFLPCKNVEWLLLEIAKNLLDRSETDNEKIYILDDLLETTTELFKIVNNDYGLAITNYLLAFRYYKSGNQEKASRLLEMVAHIFKEPILNWETQYYAALMNYPKNLRRAINLLENCLLIGEKHYIEIKKSTIGLEHVEDTLNRLRREYIIRDHENDDKAFLFKVIDNVIHYYFDKNDLLSLSACYYEAGIIFDKLGYEETSEEYFVESAIITSEHQQWKLYSKALVNLVVKFFEKGRVTEAEDYLNDLIQVATYLKDEGLHKKVETLLLSLKKLKEIKPSPISTPSRIEEYISEIDQKNTPLVSESDQTPEVSFEYETNLNPEDEINLLQSLDKLSNFEPDPTQQTNEQIIEPHSADLQNSQIDQTFLTEFKEPINPLNQSEIVISNNDLANVSQPQNQETVPDNRTFFSVRKKICKHLVNNNFEIQTDFKPVKGSVSVDIVAIRGKIRKQKLFIMIASDIEGEIELSANLLVSIFDSAERFVFVNSSTVKQTKKRGGVSVIYSLDELPV